MNTVIEKYIKDQKLCVDTYWMASLHENGNSYDLVFKEDKKGNLKFDCVNLLKYDGLITSKGKQHPCYSIDKKLSNSEAQQIYKAFISGIQ